MQTTKLYCLIFIQNVLKDRKHIYGGKSIRIYLKILLWLLLHSGMIIDFSFLLYIFLFFSGFFNESILLSWLKKSNKTISRNNSQLHPRCNFTLTLHLYINILAFLPKKDMVLPAFLDRFRRLAREINHGPEHLESCGKPAAIGTVAQWIVGNIYWIYLKSIQRS